MTLPDPAPPAPPPARMSRRLRWLLIASLTLNLLVIGVLAGAAIRFAGSGYIGPPTARSLGFGPWSGGLERADYLALRQAAEAEGFDLRGLWREERADRAALVEALKAEPFDAAALGAIADRMALRNRSRLETGQTLILSHVGQMSNERRVAFAERMERSLRRAPRDRREAPQR